jgi:hypothetical protein
MNCPVLTVRCTRKLLRHLHADGHDGGPGATTRLGDWYGNLLFTRYMRLVICMSERSLLPVFVEAKDSSSFVLKFRAAVRSVLERVGVSPDSIDSELREMSTIAIGITQSRSVLGSLNELSFLARYSVRLQSRADLTALADEIAHTPCSALKYENPKSMTLALLRERSNDV